MHAMASELYMRYMSVLKNVLPRTRLLMLIGCCALAGFPFLSGFFSKDEIIGAAWQQNKAIALLGLLTAFLTAYYTFRLYFRVFEGPELIPPPPTPDAPEVDAHLAKTAFHGDAHHHDHEPAIMIWPLVILAIGSIVAGYLNWPGEHLGEFLGKSPSFSNSWALAGKAELARPLFGQGEILDKALMEHAHYSHRIMMIISGLIALLG